MIVLRVSGVSTLDCRRKQREKIQPRVTNEVLDLCDQRRQLRQQKQTSAEAELEYREVNGECRTKMKAAKEEWTEEQLFT